jgi:ribosomal protein L40E
MTSQWVLDGLKWCTRCNRRLPVEQFTPKPQLSSGYDSWCRPCRAENLRQWRAKRRTA